MRSRLLETNEGRRVYMLVLAPGEEAVESITAFAQQEGLEGARLSAIGAFSRARLGWFDSSTGEFVENDVDEPCEVVAMAGNIAVEDGMPHLHVHICLARRDATTRGGHLVAGWARPTLEVVIEESPEHLRRARDAETGLVLLKP